jgi:hypothetical protein
MSLRDDIRIIHSEATFAQVINRLRELIRERASRSSRRSITLRMRGMPGWKCRTRVSSSSGMRRAAPP